MARGMLLYKRTRTTVKKWGDIFVGKIKQVLRADKTYASGRTLRSVEGALKVNGDIIKYEIRSRKAGNSDKSVLELIDTGRGPGRQPPTQAIRYWMEKKGVQPRFSGKYAKKSESNMNWAARKIAEAIGKRGTIKRFNYGGSGILGFVFKSQEEVMTQDIGTSLMLDIEDYIENGITAPVTGKRK
jgi:hypothetical protein